MIWKPKEKELTPEEAMAIAKKELAPFWFGSPPLIAGIENEDGNPVVIPLSKDFFNKAWMIFLIDPTDFEGENAMVYAKEWFRRYRQNSLGFIGILVPAYDYLKRPESIQKLIERQQISFPVVLDAERSLAHALDATKLPKIVLLNQGKINFMKPEEKFEEIELGLQNFLRSRDSGLALLPLFYPKTAGIRDIGKYEFGYSLKMGGRPMVFPAPGFQEGEGGLRRASFSQLAKPLGDGASNTEKFIITGDWQQFPEGIATSDANATIQIISPGGRVSVIAGPAGKPGLEPPRISVDVGGMNVYDAISGEDIRMDDSGETHIKVIKPLLYHILVGLPRDQRRVGLRFPTAKKNPIIIYGFRFGDQ